MDPRSAPEVILCARRRIRSRQVESMRGLPGRRERRRQHRRNASRCLRSTVAGWTSTNACLHGIHDRRNNSHNRRSEARKRRFERARTANWCRKASLAKVSTRQHGQPDGGDRSNTSRIALRVLVAALRSNDSCLTKYWRGQVVICSADSSFVPPKPSFNRPDNLRLEGV